MRFEELIEKINKNDPTIETISFENLEDFSNSNSISNYQLLRIAEGIRNNIHVSKLSDTARKILEDLKIKNDFRNQLATFILAVVSRNALQQKGKYYFFRKNLDYVLKSIDTSFSICRIATHIIANFIYKGLHFLTNRSVTGWNRTIYLPVFTMNLVQDQATGLHHLNFFSRRIPYQITIATVFFVIPPLISNAGKLIGLLLGAIVSPFVFLFSLAKAGYEILQNKKAIEKCQQDIKKIEEDIFGLEKKTVRKVLIHTNSESSTYQLKMGKKSSEIKLLYSDVEKLIMKHALQQNCSWLREENKDIEQRIEQLISAAQQNWKQWREPQQETYARLFKSVDDVITVDKTESSSECQLLLSN